MAILPLEDVTVTAFRFNSTTGEYINEGSDTTNAAGEYAITGLFPDEPYALKFSDNNSIFLTTYSGGLGPLFYSLDAITNLATLPDAGLTVNVTLAKGAVIDGVASGDQ